jgi:hypothetical protein
LKLRKFEVEKEGGWRKSWSFRKTLVYEVYMGWWRKVRTYAVYSGGKRIYTRAAVEENTYIHGLKEDRSCTSEKVMKT